MLLKSQRLYNISFVCQGVDLSNIATSQSGGKQSM